MNENELFALAKARQPASQNFDLKTYDIDIGKNQIHTVEVTDNSSVNSKAKAPLVIMHGYGNGVGYLFRNILPIAAQLPGRRVLGIDMLGFGLSSRPAFEFEPAPRIAAGADIEGDGNGNVHGAEDFFVNSLEKWREQQKIEKMVRRFICCRYQ